jgi:hypothetical protein
VTGWSRRGLLCVSSSHTVCDTKFSWYKLAPMCLTSVLHVLLHGVFVDLKFAWRTVGMVYCFEYVILSHLDSPFIETKLGVVYDILTFVPRHSFYKGLG